MYNIDSQNEIPDILVELGYNVDLEDPTKWPIERRLEYRDIKTYLIGHSFDRFDKPPPEFEKWFSWLNNPCLSLLPEDLVPVVTLYFSKNPVQRQTHATLWSWMPKETDIVQFTKNLQILIGLGFIIKTWDHDARGRFCRKAFSFCAEPTLLPLRQLQSFGSWLELNTRLPKLFQKIYLQAISKEESSELSQDISRILTLYQWVKDVSVVDACKVGDNPGNALKLADILAGVYSASTEVSTRTREKPPITRQRGKRATRRCKNGPRDKRWERSKRPVKAAK